MLIHICLLIGDFQYFHRFHGPISQRLQTERAKPKEDIAKEREKTFQSQNGAGCLKKKPQAEKSVFEILI